MKTTQDWEKKFRDEFNAAFTTNNCMEDYTGEHVIHFISELLEEQRVEYVREVEEIKKKPKIVLGVELSYPTEDVRGFINRTLDQVIALLTQKKES